MKENNEKTSVHKITIQITIHSKKNEIKIYKEQTINKSFEMLIFETLFKIFVDILFLSLLLKYIFNKFKILLNIRLDLYSLLKLNLAVLIFFTLTILIIDLFAQILNFSILFSSNDQIKNNVNINKEDKSIIKSGYEIFFELILPYIIKTFKSFFGECFKFINKKIIQNFNDNVAQKLINYFEDNKEINSKDIKQKILDKIYDFSTKIFHFFEKIYDYISEKVCLLGSKIKECFIELFKMIESFILSYILIPCATKIRDYLADRYHIDASDINIINNQNKTDDKDHNADAPKFVLKIHDKLDVFIKNNAKDNIEKI